VDLVGGDAPVPAPLAVGDPVRSPTPRALAIYAISAGPGAVTPEHEAMVWWKPNGGNYMQTPLVWR
jgi:hypothetical protein